MVKRLSNMFLIVARESCTLLATSYSQHRCMQSPGSLLSGFQSVSCKLCWLAWVVNSGHATMFARWQFVLQRIDFALNRFQRVLHQRLLGSSLASFSGVDAYVYWMISIHQVVYKIIQHLEFHRNSSSLLCHQVRGCVLHTGYMLVNPRSRKEANKSVFTVFTKFAADVGKMFDCLPFYRGGW